MGDIKTISTDSDEIWNRAEDEGVVVMRSILDSLSGDRPTAELLRPLFALIDTYLSDPDVDYSIQAYSWLSTMYYHLRMRDDLDGIAAIWRYITDTISSGKADKIHFALCYTFLFPLIDEPQYEVDMKLVLGLYDDVVTRPYLLEAYSHHEDPAALARDLKRYCGN